MPQMLRTDICRCCRLGLLDMLYVVCCVGAYGIPFIEIDSARYRKEAYDRRAVDHVLPPIINFILTHTKVIRPGYGQNFNRLIRQSSNPNESPRTCFMLWPRPRANRWWMVQELCRIASHRIGLDRIERSLDQVPANIVYELCQKSWRLNGRQ